MRIQQLIDKETSTLTYLIYNKGECAIIDPVIDNVELYASNISNATARLVVVIKVVCLIGCSSQNYGPLRDAATAR